MWQAGRGNIPRASPRVPPPDRSSGVVLPAVFKGHVEAARALTVQLAAKSTDRGFCFDVRRRRTNFSHTPGLRPPPLQATSQVMSRSTVLARIAVQAVHLTGRAGKHYLVSPDPDTAVPADSSRQRRSAPACSPRSQGESCRFFTAMWLTAGRCPVPRRTPRRLPPARIPPGRRTRQPAVELRRTASSPFQSDKRCSSVRGSRCFSTGRDMRAVAALDAAVGHLRVQKALRSGTMRIAPLGQPLQHAAQPVHRSRGTSCGAVFISVMAATSWLDFSRTLYHTAGSTSAPKNCPFFGQQTE